MTDEPKSLGALLFELARRQARGDYVWSRADQRTVNADGYRPLRMASEAEADIAPDSARGKRLFR